MTLVPAVMPEVRNPAIEQFAAAIQSELMFGQVRIRRLSSGFELRHVENADANEQSLRTVPISDLRLLAQFTATGAFRPLKSAPNLQAGWRATASNVADLERALSHLYPGGVPDWFAAQQQPVPVTNYRDFTERQTGMYRITTHLSDREAGEVIRACCAPQFCLKRRLWTVEGLPSDGASDKSLIACLEPCAVLLEFARTAVRLNQLGETEAQDASAPDQTVREADFSSPKNPRRIQLRLEKLKHA